jgi:hypothetical protein
MSWRYPELLSVPYSYMTHFPLGFSEIALSCQGARVDLFENRDDFIKLFGGE